MYALPVLSHYTGFVWIDSTLDSHPNITASSQLRPLLPASCATLRASGRISAEPTKIIWFFYKSFGWLVRVQSL